MTIKFFSVVSNLKRCPRCLDIIVDITRNHCPQCILKRLVKRSYYLADKARMIALGVV